METGKEPAGVRGCKGPIQRSAFQSCHDDERAVGSHYATGTLSRRTEMEGGLALRSLREICVLELRASRWHFSGVLFNRNALVGSQIRELRNSATGPKNIQQCDPG